MKKIGDFICNNKFLIVIISLILLVLSFIGILKTKINYDILVYLPDDIETIKGQNILTNDFKMGAYSIAVIENMKPSSVTKLESEIKKIDGVNNAVSIYDVIGDIPVMMLPNKVKDKLHKENTDIIFITFEESTSNEKTINAVKEIRKTTDGVIKQGGMSSMVLDTMELSQKEIMVYIVIAVLLCIVVLEISLNSYLVPFILLINIGFSIVYNLGTNVFLGQISYITKALVAVLQLGVTTDFSIFLYHSYEENKKKYKSRNEAMSIAIKDTFVSVTGSSLTTIVGFLALCAMKLTLGYDLGIVMAKGVFLGVISVLTVFPSMLLLFDKYLDKTKHKELMPNFNKYNSFIVKHNKVIFIMFLILLIPTYFAQKNTVVYYNLDSSLPDTLESISTNKILKEKYNIVNPEMILIDKKLKDDEVNEMINDINKIDGIDFVLSLRSIKKFGITEDMLPSKFNNLFESDKYELLLVNSLYETATNELNNQIDEINKIVKSYDKNAIVAGEGALTKDLIETYDTDYNNVNYFSIICIFIVLLFVLKSFIVPILLIVVIEGAIFINLSISYFDGSILPFIAPITLGTIQLGATIDYAILVTTTYLSKRKEGMNKEEAMIDTLNNALPSILISGMCFFAATFGVGIYSNIEMIGSICTLISRGALISVFIVSTCLPSVLLTFDKIIFKKKGNVKMKKSTKKLAILLLIMLLIFPNNTHALSKHEVVYGSLDYNGKVNKLIVNEQIINDEKLSRVEDSSILEDIVNLKNDYTYEIKDSRLVWDAKEDDIFYKGTTSKTLPVTLTATYYLDSKELRPQDMLGKSGKVEIKLKYKNNQKHGSLYTPFVVTAATIIDGNTNKNVRIDNGKVINNGNDYIVVGIVSPGLYESLDFEELKGMDTINISYYTSKFELSSIYSLISTKLIDSSDLKIFDKMDDIYKNINTLQKSMNQIENGSKKINNGLNLLYTNYDKFNEGINTFNKNFNLLNDGTHKLNDEVNNVLNNESVKEFRAYLPKLENDANKIKEITNKYSSNIEEYASESNKIVDGITSDILNIINYLETVDEYLDSTHDYNSIVSTYSSNMSKYINEISSFLDISESYLDKLDNISSFAISSADYIIKTYEEDSENASDELKELYKEAKKIKNSDIANLKKSIEKDKKDLEKLKTSLNKEKERLESVTNKLTQDDSKLIKDLDSIRKSSVDLKEVESKIKEANKSIHNNINNIDKNISIINELPDKINKIENGINEFESGVKTISDATGKLQEGMNLLSGYSNQIYGGINQLKNGTNELSNGITKFNKEGINKINSIVNKDIKNTITKTKDLIKLGENYTSFTGSNMDGDTKFVLVIDSLNVKEEKTKQTSKESDTVLDRILNLFK